VEGVLGDWHSYSYSGLAGRQAAAAEPGSEVEIDRPHDSIEVKALLSMPSQSGGVPGRNPLARRELQGSLLN